MGREHYTVIRKVGGPRRKPRRGGKIVSANVYGLQTRIAFSNARRRESDFPDNRIFLIKLANCEHCEHWNGWGSGIREWGLGSGVTNDFDFCEERKKDGLEHVTNGGVRI